MTTVHPNLSSPRYGLLLAEMCCHHCEAPTPVAAVWISNFEERDEGKVIDSGEAALLLYPEWLDEAATRLIRMHAPWRRLAATRTSGMTYWANHCRICGAVHGDHYVGGADGPFWPQDEAALERLRFIRGAGPLQAVGSTSQSLWMTRVEDVCHSD
ncbi:TPA: hypothetical protein UOJ00_003014 [Stenotrophomonas maltophilia]|nr:hypothetical protein [Stenotrophomonas maltophilia]